MNCRQTIDGREHPSTKTTQRKKKESELDIFRYWQLFLNFDIFTNFAVD